MDGYEQVVYDQLSEELYRKIELKMGEALPYSFQKNKFITIYSPFLTFSYPFGEKVSETFQENQESK